MEKTFWRKEDVYCFGKLFYKEEIWVVTTIHETPILESLIVHRGWIGNYYDSLQILIVMISNNN